MIRNLGAYLFGVLRTNCDSIIALNSVFLEENQREKSPTNRGKTRLPATLCAKPLIRGVLSNSNCPMSGVRTSGNAYKKWS